MFLKDNPAMLAEVEEKVKGILGIKALSATEAEPAEE
jgi:hypothetical protein